MNINEPLLPPRKHINKAECHWVQQIDFDGRSMGYDIWRWQPVARKWCRPNEYSTGVGDELKGYRWVAVCPQPMFREETEDIKKMFERVGKQTTGDCVTISKSDFEMLRLFFYENIVEIVNPN